MNDRRYFYTDPLAAAWMMAHFGFRFVDEKGCRIISIGNPWVFNYHGRDAEPVVMDHQAKRFYVHPDSLHLLIPQVSDIVLNCDSDPARVVSTGKHQYGHYEAPLCHAIEFVASGSATIIQRDGISFMWPETVESISA